MTTRKYKLPKRLRPPLVLLVSGLSFYLVYVLMFSYGSSISGEILKELVSEQSEGSYSLHFEEIDLSFYKKTLDLTNLEIRPDTTGNLDSVAHFYEVFVPNLQISFSSLLAIYTRRELTFRNIAVKDPAIKMTRTDEMGSRKTFSLETGDLYQLISGYLMKFSIDSLGLTGGSIGYRPEHEDEDYLLFLDNIHFQVKNLLIDSTDASSQQFLSTEGIELILTNQQFLLADSLHYIAFEKFSLSTKSKDILFTNLNLKQRDDKALTEVKGLNRYDIQLPKLNFRGINFLKAYQENKLVLDSVRVVNPTVKITHVNQPTRIVDRNDLASMVQAVFSEVKVGRLYMDNARTVINVDAGKHNHSLRSGSSSVQIDGFVLDSSHVGALTQNIFFRHIMISSKDHELLLPDSSHVIRFQHLYLSTIDSELRMDTVSIEPIGNQEIPPYTLNANIARIRLFDFDWEKALNTKVLDIGDANLYNPEISLKLSKTEGAPPELPKALSIKNFNVYHGELEVHHPKALINVNDLSMSLALDPEAKDTIQSSLHWLLSLKDIEWNHATYQDAEKSLNIRNLKGTEALWSVALSGLEFHEKSKSFPLRASSVEWGGFDLLHYLKNDQFLFDSLLIQGPEVEIELSENVQQQGRVGEILQKFSFNKVSVGEGKVTIYDQKKTLAHLGNISAAVTHYSYEVSTDQYQVEADLHIDSTSFALTKIGHQVIARGISYSGADSTLSVGHINGFPNSTALPASGLFQVATDTLTLRQIDLNGLINNRTLQFGHGSLGNPTIDIRAPSASESTPSKLLSKMKFDSLLISNGDLVYTNQIGLKAKVEGIDLTMVDFDTKAGHLLHTKNFLVYTREASLKIPKMGTPILIGSIEANTEKGNFELSGVSFSSAQSFAANIPTLLVSGLDTRELFQSNNIWMDTLRVSRPILSLGLGGQEESKLPWLKANYVSIDDASMSIYHPKISKTDSLHLNSFHLAVNKLDYSTTEDISKTAHLFESIDLSGEDFAYTLPDGMSKIKIDQYRYDHLEKKIRLDGLRFDPLYNRGEFQNQIQFQKDWFKGSAQHLELTGFELDSLLFGDKLQVESVHLASLNLDTHRDKRLPREEGLYKPLPQSLLRSVGMRIGIDTLRVTQSYISHSEFSENGEKPGVIFFRDINASITNITNDTVRLSLKKQMVFKASGSLMNTGDFLLQVKFDLMDSMDSYFASGRIGTMELTEMNKFLENTAFVQIREGKGESASFIFEGNEEYSMGTMRFYYDNLKIAVLNKDAPEHRSLGASMKTFFANTFVVNSQNPHLLLLRKGDIFHERDRSKSIFNAWGKSLLSGVVSSIGGKNNKKEIRQKNEEIRQKLEEGLQP